MLKSNYIITLLSGIGLFNSCTANFINFSDLGVEYAVVERKNSAYGSYLAGRVAHIRQDYDNAAYYYEKSISQGFSNSDIIGKTYIILASQGKIKEATKYANMARQNGDNNNFIDVINAIYEFKEGNYKFARSLLSKISEKTYENLITPMFNAWSYVGDGDYQKAIDSLSTLSTEEDMQTVYHLHAGLIAEYFNYPEIAKKHYDIIINNRSEDISFRALQLITNYMVRNNRKEEALNLVNKYYGASNIKEMLASLSEKIKESDSTTQLIVNTPNIGAGEVFLEIALLFKSIPVGYDYAQMYMAISEYFNPNNDVVKIAMADLFEDRFLLKDANKYYDTIKKESELYYPSQIKKANNLMAQEKYEEAALVLRKLLKNNPKNFQVLFNLGDVLRISDNQKDAIKYYTRAIDSIFYENEKYWPVYYALAVSYDKSDDWKNAEENLNKALRLSNRHPQVLNYLGYSWLKNNSDLDRAVSFILEAYEKDPNDSVIMDSLGWVYFKTGDYENAIVYLEKASELNPRNAIISDHLGDAYWLGGRKNEAVFLWNQALLQKEDGDEISHKKIRSKIKNGIKKIEVISLKDEKVRDTLKQIKSITQ
ncbi:MAG: tetratricopeptide repeat protein [Alphaproteobacteria bacterium]|nr:tetratricopeptide repeat protein [Alphaproteobacteria bacterium]